MKFSNRYIVLTAIFPLFLLFVGLSYISPAIFFVHTPSTSSSPQDSIVSLRFIAVGDLMCHSPEFQYARVSADSFDFKPFFSFVKPIIKDADICFGNLETVIAGKEAGYSGYPFFNSPDAFLSAIQDAGFNLLTTANNHCFDQAESGVLRTIRKLNELNIPYTGTADSPRDRDSLRIYTKNGITFALLAYSYSTNDNPVAKAKKYLVSLIDTNKIVADIITAKSKSDIVMVYVHFGNEYKRKPSHFQESVVNAAIRAGADVILGSHPHVLQPIELIASNHGKLDTALVAYSLGNFISNQRDRYTDAGALLRFTIEKNITKGKLSLKNIEFIPTWVYKGDKIENPVFYILPKTGTDSSYSFLNARERLKMEQAFSDTKTILTERAASLRETVK